MCVCVCERWAQDGAVRSPGWAGRPRPPTLATFFGTCANRFHCGPAVDWEEGWAARWAGGTARGWARLCAPAFAARRPMAARFGAPKRKQLEEPTCMHRRGKPLANPCAMAMHAPRLSKLFPPGCALSAAAQSAREEHKEEVNDFVSGVPLVIAFFVFRCAATRVSPLN